MSNPVPRSRNDKGKQSWLSWHQTSKRGSSMLSRRKRWEARLQGWSRFATRNPSKLKAKFQHRAKVIGCPRIILGEQHFIIQRWAPNNIMHMGYLKSKRKASCWSPNQTKLSILRWPPLSETMFLLWRIGPKYFRRHYTNKHRRLISSLIIQILPWQTILNNKMAWL